MLQYIHIFTVLSIGVLSHFSQEYLAEERVYWETLVEQFKRDIEKAKGEQTFIYDNSARIESLNRELEDRQRECDQFWKTLKTLGQIGSRQTSVERLSLIPFAETTVISDEFGLAPGCISGCVKWSDRSKCADKIGCSMGCQCLYCLWSGKTQQ